jgi:Zn-dependent M28 family amino/carboxypeptidase
VKNYIDLVREIDHRTNVERREFIENELDKLSIKYSIHSYATGQNIIVDLGEGGMRIGISSHYDKVQGSGGANDNGAAIAVCIDIIRRHQNQKSQIPLRVFFFDEEEINLRGSSAYVTSSGTQDILAIINMELVGVGDQFAIWPVPTSKESPLLKKFESEASMIKKKSTRFDQIITNSADHLPFLNHGVDDSFTITCISDEDLRIAAMYYEAMYTGKPFTMLQNIILSAPTFSNYHKSTDTADKLEFKAIQMTSDCIWNTIKDFAK